MSDFLCVFHRELSGADLVELLRVPYRGAPRIAHGFDFAWGAFALLEEPWGPRAFQPRRGAVLAWVGDLLGAGDAGLIERLHDACLDAQEGKIPDALLSLAREQDGAFALCHASPQGCRLLGDFSAFTPLYAARGARGVRACGTHPDLVAAAGLAEPEPDLASLAHFINFGYTPHPFTSQAGVSELPPACAHTLVRGADGSSELASHAYWTPPPERRSGADPARLRGELAEILVASVRDRCDRSGTAVSLSGGLDSRVIAAAVPPEHACLFLTMCDADNRDNRETRTARAVADAYRRPWQPLARGPEYLASQLDHTVRLSGCESEWVTAHSIGFGDRLAELGVDSLLTGLGYDSYLKGYFARDFRRRTRWRGLRPPVWERQRYDLLDVTDFCREHVAPEALAEGLARRQALIERSHDAARGSPMEMLFWFPFRRRVSAAWTAERKLLPVRLVAMDRRAVEFAMACPLELRLGGRLFVEAAVQVLGPGRRVPIANDGVRPGSGTLSRLVQRAAHQARERSAAFWLRGRRGVQHSWHDYPYYWRNSEALARLKEEYGPALARLSGGLFDGDPLRFLRDRELLWNQGFRLMHLAAWLTQNDELRRVRARLSGRQSGPEAVDRTGL